MVQPLVIHEVAEARQWVRDAQSAGERVGVVPTMGALHAGHLSLVTAAKRTCDRVVTTIFVNPTQFGPHEDLEKYPRTWDRDLEHLSAAKVDVVFAPSTTTMYPRGDGATSVLPSRVAKRWEGEFRPEHFGGVATIVLKLFQIVPANAAFFGEKDFQQCRVISDMVEDLNLPIELEFVPIRRDDDGLALSSRNAYLSDEERHRALSLSQALRDAAASVAAGERDAGTIQRSVRRTLENAPVDRIDYIAVCAADTLEPVDKLTGNEMVLIAAHVGKTRLIDNTQLRF